MDGTNLKSHVAVLAEVRGAIGRLLKDPLLTDLRPGVTPGEVNSQLAVLQGRALTLLLRTNQDETTPVVVLQGCTVRDVMQAVERAVSSTSGGMNEIRVEDVLASLWPDKTRVLFCNISQLWHWQPFGIEVHQEAKEKGPKKP